MAIPGLVAASNLADTENKEAVWDNLGNGIEAVILATNFIRNNTMVGSVAGTPGTLPTNWSAVAVGLTITVVGTGVSSGINYIDIRFNGTTSGATDIQVKVDGNVGAISASAGQPWVLSSWVALVGGSTANITNQWLVINEYSTGAIFVGSSFVASNILAGDTTFTRVSGAKTLGASTALIEPIIVLRTGSSVAIDITLRIGMPQLERGEYVTPPIATTNAPASALATVPLSIQGDDILELVGARLAATSDFVRIKGLTTLAQPRLTTAAANTASGAALRDNALLKASPSSEGDYFLSRGTLDGQSLRVNGLNIASLSGSPFSGSTASCPLLISSFAAPTNLRINNAMASGTLAFPERAIPIETDQFIFYAKAGQS
jgi:multisubunit Na+/H+ antiporter MnhF subunit